MCGRYAHRRPDAEVWSDFVPDLPQTQPRYNIAPGTDCLIVHADGGATVAGLMHWGFAPRWLRDANKAQINARSETAAEKPMFRDSFRKRRCLVPADGWYEWLRDGKVREPYFFQLKDAAPFAFAGIWSAARDDGLPTFAVLTTAPNGIAARVHGRMPVVLPQRDWAEWLDEHAQGPGRLQFLCRTREDLPVEAWPVSPAVNRPQHDEPDCTEPTGPSVERA